MASSAKMPIDAGGGVQPGPAWAPRIDLLVRDHEIDGERAPLGPCFCHRILRIRVRHVTNVVSGSWRITSKVSCSDLAAVSHPLIGGY
jgi:hypothetical protein